MVYLDGMKAKFGNMIMCHMVADSTEELLEMCDKIGVQRKWIQYAGTGREHFDISLTKKALAIKYGAIETSWRKAAELFSREFIPKLGQKHEPTRKL